MTLDELLRRALGANPSLSVAREELSAAQSRVGAASSRLSPALQVVPGVGGSRDARDEEIILSQPVDFFGQRRARSNVARAEVRRAEAASVLAQRTLIVQVKGAAADLFAAQEAESLGEAQVEVARAFRDASARRAQLGDVPPVQAQRADLELLRTQNELSNARAERLARRALLNQLTGAAPEAPLRVALPLDPSAIELLRAVPSTPGLLAGVGASTSALPGNSGAVPSVTLPATPAVPTASTSNAAGGEASAPLLGASSQVGSDLVAARASLHAGIASRPDIAGAQAMLEARRAQVEVLAASRRPQVELQVRRNAVFSGSGSTALRAVVTIPLGSGPLRGERRALEAEARAQEAQIALLRSQAAAQVEGALIRLQQQRETVERYRRPVTGIVPQTLDLLRKTQLGYAAGASTYLEVLEAQRTTRQVQTEYLQALVGAQTQQIALETALGSNLPSALAGPLANPNGAEAPPGVAAPGTVPQGTIPPVETPPLNPPGVDLPGTLPPASDAQGGAR